MTKKLTRKQEVILLLINKLLCVFAGIRLKLMKRTQFDVHRQCYDELASELKTVEHDLIRDLLRAWDVSFKQMDNYLLSKQVTKSQVSSGLRQGLKDLPEILDDLPESIRETALAKYKLVMSKYE
ncbi:hypothetical protein ACED29_20875 [Shewanella sp. 5S214]|uniref:hypothetical protein n=1 Tax=Shewanella sp. 5S214 TaxID=3229999 RepID=UPI00352DEFAA